MSFPVIDERAWWNGKDQCKTLCCSRRGDTGTLEEKRGNPAVVDCDFCSGRFLSVTINVFFKINISQTTLL